MDKDRLSGVSRRLLKALAHPGTIGWSLTFLVAIVALLVTNGMGIFEASRTGWAQCLATAVLGLMLALGREAVLSPLDRLADNDLVALRVLAHAIALARDVAVLVLMTGATSFALEASWNPGAASIDATYLGLENHIVLAVLATLYLVGLRRGALPALGSLALGALGIAQGFMLTFKGTAILPSDLMSLGTAAAVAGGYTYDVTPAMASALAQLLAGLVAAQLMRPAGKPICRLRWVRPAATLACGLFCLYLGVNSYNTVDLAKRYDIDIDYWWPISSYETYGLLPSYLTIRQNMVIDMPDGYTDEVASATEAELAQDGTVDVSQARSEQFSSMRPCVVAVMNETFSDLSSMYGDLDVGYEGPAFFNSIDDALVRGQLSVSAYGGGTCNSEFEFLTGNSLAHIGMGMYPYTLYDLSAPNNLARQLSDLGYETTAIHPNLGSNWNRDLVYADMGFDQFLTIDDFEGAPTYHSGVTDQATYERVLEQLRSSDEPQFVMDVTMQNHSSFDQHNIPEEDLRGYETGLGEQTDGYLNEYLACIDSSDRDLEWFIGQLRELDRPVVLVFFGDHQPNFGSTLNDALFDDAGTAAHAARAYQTNYLVWANYEVADWGSMRREDASSSTLGALALSAVGAPLTSYEQASLGARLSMPMVNLFAYKDDLDEWHNSTSAKRGEAGATSADDVFASAQALEAYRKMALVQYLEFAEKVQ